MAFDPERVVVPDARRFTYARGGHADTAQCIAERAETVDEKPLRRGAVSDILVDI